MPSADITERGQWWWRWRRGSWGRVSNTDIIQWYLFVRLEGHNYSLSYKMKREGVKKKKEKKAVWQEKTLMKSFPDGSKWSETRILKESQKFPFIYLTGYSAEWYQIMDFPSCPCLRIHRSTREAWDHFISSICKWQTLHQEILLIYFLSSLLHTRCSYCNYVAPEKQREGKNKRHQTDLLKCYYSNKISSRITQ